MLRCSIYGGEGNYYLEKGTKCMQIKRFVQMINESNNIIFFGGAGVSTEFAKDTAKKKKL